MLALAPGKKHSARRGVYGYLVLLTQHTKSTKAVVP